MARWNMLPDDIQCKIFNTLDTWDRWPCILVCKAWKQKIEDPLNQPDSVILLPKDMHISCLRTLSGNLKSLECRRNDVYDSGRLDLVVAYNCVLTRAATMGVQHLDLNFAPPGHWALSMFLWKSLQTLRVNFVGVHQLEEFADSFSGLSKLKELQLKVSYVDHKAWNGKDPDEYDLWSDSDNEDDCIHRASTCYAERIFPVLQDIEKLCVRPLLQSEFEILLQHLPRCPRLRDLGIRRSRRSDFSRLLLKIPLSLSPNLGKLTILRWPVMDKLKGIASVFDSLEELYIGDSEPFEANTLQEFKCLKHVHVWRKKWFNELSVWLCSHCPHMTCTGHVINSNLFPGPTGDV